MNGYAVSVMEKKALYCYYMQKADNFVSLPLPYASFGTVFVYAFVD